jgi:tight adherence protein C
MRPVVLPVVAAFLSAVTAALTMRALVPPAPRLANRVRPYSLAARSALGTVEAPTKSGAFGAGVAGWVARRLGRVFNAEDEEGLSLRLRQSGLFPGLSGAEAVNTYRVKQVTAGFTWLGLSVMAAIALELPGGRGAALALLGSVIGIARQRGRIDRTIDGRRQRMRIEIYTVNQLLAMRIRAGGGVVQAVSQVCQRGQGEVVGELAEALRLHRAGMRAAEAFRRIAALTPESECARTYGLLAAADERGADLGLSLLALAEDVREGRREAIRRAATKRRAAMLVPIIGILAPVMLLFVGAPLPSLLFNWS